MIEYKNDYAIFDGMKFKKDVKTGYYLNSTHRIRLHRYVWIYYNGDIPEGHEIHHDDCNKDNNDIINLTLLSRSEHSRIHGKKRFEDLEFKNKFQVKGIEAAKEWHKSYMGLEWHKQHYINNKQKLHKDGSFKCLYCNKEYTAEITGENKFCSNGCKSAYRRRSGVDNETRKCEYCGEDYETNKYRKTKVCSTRCSNKLRSNKEH